MEIKDTAINVTATIDINEEDLKKVKKLVELLKEAKSLADDLASIEFEIKY